ncbi:MAG: hypothetical protein IRZ16_07575 [Myxococcaceae bacterium]|nr:hypothetical protein [Myxococcaceae bacterium]
MRFALCVLLFLSSVACVRRPERGASTTSPATTQVSTSPAGAHITFEPVTIVGSPSVRVHRGVHAARITASRR